MKTEDTEPWHVDTRGWRYNPQRLSINADNDGHLAHIETVLCRYVHVRKEMLQTDLW